MHFYATLTHQEAAQTNLPTTPSEKTTSDHHHTPQQVHAKTASTPRGHSNPNSPTDQSHRRNDRRPNKPTTYHKPPINPRPKSATATLAKHTASDHSHYDQLLANSTPPPTHIDHRYSPHHPPQTSGRRLQRHTQHPQQTHTNRTTNTRTSSILPKRTGLK